MLIGTRAGAEADAERDLDDNEEELYVKGGAKNRKLAVVCVKKIRRLDFLRPTLILLFFFFFFVFVPSHRKIDRGCMKVLEFWTKLRGGLWSKKIYSLLRRSWYSQQMKTALTI